MSGFEFIFTLFGLLLGLALAEGLGSLSNAIKARHKVRIGWATALLGLFVSCDIVTFWAYGWSLREAVQVSWPFLFGGFVITAIYFVTASLIFPHYPEEWSSLDDHFDANRRLVLGGVLICNIALLGFTVSLVGLAPMLNLRTAIVTWSFFPVCLLAMWAKDRRMVIACMIWLIALYPLSAAWH